jgi:hypothetical protein
VKGRSRLPAGGPHGKSIAEPSEKKLLFSLRDFDQTQGQTFSQWEKESLLGLMLERLRQYGQKTRMEAEKAGLTVYGSFPINSEFKHPKYVTEDAEWASMRIKGKERVAGHVIGNVFYIVFLDMEHQFWCTEKKHT